jgi:hypothetical protein
VPYGDGVRARLIIGVILVLVGAVWFGQGIGAIGGSFMTGEALWAVIGAVCVFFGAALLIGARRARRSRSL